MSYTKGPWQWKESESGFGYRLFPGILETESKDATPWGDEIDRANARLIAAAPELLEAAQLALSIAEIWIHSELDGTSKLDDELKCLSSVRNTIAKAKGE